MAVKPGIVWTNCDSISTWWDRGVALATPRLLPIGSPFFR